MCLFSRAGIVTGNAAMVRGNSWYCLRVQKIEFSLLLETERCRDPTSNKLVSIRTSALSGVNLDGATVVWQRQIIINPAVVWQAIDLSGVR